MKTARILLAALFSLGITSIAQAGVTYSDLPNGGGFSPLANPNTTTYGQVFTVPNDGNTRLDSFSLYIRGNLAKVYGGVAAWNGTGAGPALFASSPFGATFGEYTEVTVNTGGLDLLAGHQYVEYFSVAGISGNSGYDAMESGTGGSIFNGLAWDNNNGGSPNHDGWNGAQNASWGSFASTLSFSAPSGEVPEPASLALLGLGIAGLAAARRRKG